MSKRGIDVSEFNGKIDWEKVKKSGKVDFAIIRSSLGWTDGDVETRRDKRFIENIAGCERWGIPYGIYHYSYCLKPENAQKEAEYVVRNIEGTRPSMGVWYDIEDSKQIPLGKTALTRMAKTFCETLYNAGYDVGVYSYLAWLNQYLDMDALSDYPCWVAQVNVPKPTYTKPYVMWQYSWTGSIDGIKGNVDLNESYLVEKNYFAESLDAIISALEDLRSELAKLQ
jgi:GH25 family lysozyme M1 (1,4-beta-N-acetylmuramidase)